MEISKEKPPVLAEKSLQVQNRDVQNFDLDKMTLNKIVPIHKNVLELSEEELTLTMKTKKIFVGGLSATTRLKDFRAYFEQFGKVKRAILAYDKVTNHLRGFGFVTFDKEDVVEKICEIRFHTINGKYFIIFYDILFGFFMFVYFHSQFLFKKVKRLSARRHYQKNLDWKVLQSRWKTKSRLVWWSRPSWNFLTKFCYKLWVTCPPRIF